MASTHSLALGLGREGHRDSLHYRDPPIDQWSAYLERAPRRISPTHAGVCFGGASATRLHRADACAAGRQPQGGALHGQLLPDPGGPELARDAADLPREPVRASRRLPPGSSLHASRESPTIAFLDFPGSAVPVVHCVASAQFGFLIPQATQG